MNNTLIIFVFALLICSCSSKEEMPEPVTDDKFEFVGNWLGSWSDSLFPSILVSAQVRNVSTNKFSGAFYYNNNGTGPYTPCCGGVNDGIISFETKGDSVINFLYVQNAPEYRGGCPGTYEGSGVLDNNVNRLIIKFRGEDCDGVHENGQIVWRVDR